MTQARLCPWPVVVGFIVTAVFWAFPHMAAAQEAQVIANGKRLYEWYCEFCHGVEGKGDGPMAATLTIKPDDLAQLSKKNKGQFPFWKIYPVIEGKEEVRGHGSSAMPLWGPVFRRQESEAAPEVQDDIVMGRILSLLFYLESIQQK